MLPLFCEQVKGSSLTNTSRMTGDAMNMGLTTATVGAIDDTSHRIYRPEMEP